MKQTHENVSDVMSAARDRHRGQVDLLLSRLDLLEGRAKVMMKMHFEKGNSFRQMARLLGVSETSVARRIHRISARLLDGRYIACLRNRDRLTRHQMSVAKDYFLKGLSQSKIAETKRWSLYRVGRTLREIQSVIAETQQLSRRA
ncbi:MAG: sigma factor-like helix-turn-helix DNA-binding protein [Planctomycetota bacterium]